jgi:hypothetical protein
MAQSSIIVLMLALCGAQRCSSFGAGSVPPLVSIAGQARVSVRGGASARGADRGHAALAMRSVGEAHFLERALTRRTALLLPAVAIVLCDHPLRAAAEANALKTDMLKLKVGLKGLNYLLDNFDNETTQCNYAQLDRALLAQDKKSELLEAATTNALFDKDNKYMIIKCKRNPSGIKQYLGTCPKCPRPARFMVAYSSYEHERADLTAHSIDNLLLYFALLQGCPPPKTPCIGPLIW